MKDTYLGKISNVLRKGVSTGLDVFDFADSLSTTQFISKEWLVETLLVTTASYQLKPNPRILILGGWYGSYLVPLLLEKIKPEHIFLNDIDRRCLEVAKELHAGESVSFHCFDATKKYPQSFNVDIVINTSCEHISSYDLMFEENPGALFVLQSCDNRNDPGHVNTSSSTYDFLTKLRLTDILYKGRTALGHKNRFMVIGIR